MKKRLLATALAAVLVSMLAVSAFAVGTGESALTFTDVEGHWASDSIQYCWENGLLKGRTESTFEPDGKLTVAEAVTLAGRLCYVLQGGEGDLPAVPDLTKPYARFFDENGTEIAVLDQEHGPEAIAWGGGYVALSALEDDPALPETCTVEVGLEGLFPTRTSQCTRQTYAPTGGMMSYGRRGTGYIMEDTQVLEDFLRIHTLVNPDLTTANSANEWWYPADFYLRYYNDYSAVPDMCVHIAVAHPDENGWVSSDFDAVDSFPKENITRAMFACLINGAVSEELPVLNSAPSVPDVDLTENVDAEAILRLYGAGIITGVDSAGSFHCDGELTRAQAAAILARVLDPAQRVKLP